MKEVHNLTQFDMMSDRSGTIATIWGQHCFYTIKLAMVFLTLERANHFLHKIVDIEKFHIDSRIIDSDGKIVSNIVAESGNSRIVVGAAPLSIEIGESVDENLCARFFTIPEHELFASLLALSVFTCTEAPGESGLDRT